MPYSILDRPCRKCGEKPAQYEQLPQGHRRTCVNCRARYQAQRYTDGLTTPYKPLPGRNFRLRSTLVKRCTKCEAVKPIDEFYYSSKADDRRQSRCKECSDTARTVRLERDPNRAASQKRRMDRFKVKLLPYRMAVYEYYGKCCYCCGESEIELLTIDHVNNDGGEQRRKKRGNTGAFFYREIVERGFPVDLRLSCWNCNSGRHRNGGICPHEQRRMELMAA